ncbi:HetZ-related protein [Trichothermofontia sichuanensis B231]|uniref:HetZ-related protein n=1 Tax=Trichothermofontia sichuanensis TaxID=3045816 RepID=UPI0022484E3C|nr:HetZ-related protein [Trichothermofontia sichuanensis]UZQ55540.1 HetZ-related protein [Trichothermofontia sichuanensis B231]
MNTQSANSPGSQGQNSSEVRVLDPAAPTATTAATPPPAASGLNLQELGELLLQELQAEVRSRTGQAVATRIAKEVDRICQKSDRIQTSGEVQTWQLTLARHRLHKCLAYYRLGSQQGRVELHSTLSTIVYRHIVPMHLKLGFQARHALIEDFLQGFYMEALKVFRRENELAPDYSPRTQLELAEYMAFTEHYAKRRIALPGHNSQQLIVLRAQGFARRQPQEATLDFELAMESPKREESEGHSRSAVVQQVREQMVADAVDLAEGVLRDRVVTELIQYLQAQGQSDCIDYLVLKLQDLSAPEIDSILGLTARQRDYLQQRFKYHVEKFARSHQWQLVHQWLGADLDQNLGMAPAQWQAFLAQLTPEQRTLLTMKQEHASDEAIAKAIKCTPKQAQKRWYRILELAWQARNQTSKEA